MSPRSQTFTQAYREAFEAYLAQRGEAALEQAYELGRQAMGDGVGLLDLVEMQRALLRDALRATASGPESAEARAALCADISDRALTFLAEALSPYEMTYRGFQDAVAQLQQLNQTLEARVADRSAEAERARDEAITASRAKSDFLAVISHELRTPLNAIMGYAELLLMERDASLDERAREKITRILANAQHLLELVEEILAFTRLEGRRERVQIEPVSVPELTREAVEQMRPLARRKGLRFRVELPEDDQRLMIETDRAKVRQILVNLLSNAVKFTDAGEIALIGRVADDHLEIEVTDTGIGIAPEDRERVFEAFWQADPAGTRRAGGAGLGLSVSRGLARLLGGEVTVAARPDGGSSFTLRLPLRPG